MYLYKIYITTKQMHDISDLFTSPGLASTYVINSMPGAMDGPGAFPSSNVSKFRGQYSVL